MISSTLGCEVQQELYLANQYEKARQDVGLFLSSMNVSFRFSFQNLGSKWAIRKKRRKAAQQRQYTFKSMTCLMW